MAFIFKDKLGREWDCAIDVPTIERVAATGTCDLFGALENDSALYKSIMTSRPQLMGVVWAIIAPQAEAKGITIDDWKKSINGDAIEAMGEAFTFALADFSPAQKRGLILKGWEKGKKLDELMTAKNHLTLDGYDPEELATKMAHKSKTAIDALLNPLTQEVSAVSSGDMLAKSVSSPGQELPSKNLLG